MIGKKYINHIFITMWNLAYFSGSVEILANIFLDSWLHLHEKVMEMWQKCDELTLVLIFWLLSFENSRHAKTQCQMPDATYRCPCDCGQSTGCNIIHAVWFIRNTYKKHSLEFWKFKKQLLVCQEGLRNSGTHFV